MQQKCTVQKYYCCCLCCSYRSSLSTNDLTPYLILKLVSLQCMGLKITVLRDSPLKFDSVVFKFCLNNMYFAWLQLSFNENKSISSFCKICVNFPCKLEAPFDVCSNREVCSVWVVDCCPSASALQEPETDKEVPERMGAAAAAENDQGLRWQVAGRQRRTEDRVHVQAQHLQDGLCLQVRRLHVQAYGTDTGSPGERWKHFNPLHYPSRSSLHTSVPVWRHLDLQLSCLVDLSFSPTNGSTLACTGASRPGWTPGLRNTWPPAWLPTPTSGWWETTKRVCCPAPPPATPRSFTISTLTSTGWSTEPCSLCSAKAPQGWVHTLMPPMMDSDAKSWGSYFIHTRENWFKAFHCTMPFYWEPTCPSGPQLCV